jgi:hypothetical protein
MASSAFLKPAWPSLFGKSSHFLSNMFQRVSIRLYSRRNVFKCAGKEVIAAPTSDNFLLSAFIPYIVVSYELFLCL